MSNTRIPLPLPWEKEYNGKDKGMPLGELIKKLTLDNGLVLEVIDESSNYYADFGRLKLAKEIKGTRPRGDDED